MDIHNLLPLIGVLRMHMQFCHQSLACLRYSLVAQFIHKRTTNRRIRVCVVCCIFVCVCNLDAWFGCSRVAVRKQPNLLAQTYSRLSLVSSAGSDMPRQFVSPINVLQWFSIALSF
ncbi:uncharacterized protein LOC143184687 [Calliopsis andreniformis]|uniref:uncharacterized protein LOC143184687 n=1 Tax=Calliopsis andreniformis TaxID=337506 RepID=UPI003FCD4293